MRPENLLLSGFFLLVLAGCCRASDETVPPDSWVYPALRKFELLGLLHLEPSMPYTRCEVEHYVMRVLSALGGGREALTGRQRFLLDRLQAEFAGKSSDPQSREDGPSLLFRDGELFLTLDVAAGGAFRKRIGEKKGEAGGLLVPEILLDLGNGLTVQTSYRVEVAPERDSRERNLKPGPRTRSFRGVTSEYERAVVSFRGSRWRAAAGRDYIHWGNGREDGLVLSRAAGSLDHFLFEFSLGRFKLATFHALLDPGIPRRLAGHRLSVRLPRGIFIGVGETALYAGRSFDFAYLLPFSAYYANQFNEAGDDNILWALDWKVPDIAGFLVYGELLIDDFQYERDPPAPDRLGFNLTLERLFMLGGREIELLASYTYIDIYTYAQEESHHTSYVTGEGNYGFDRIIGSRIGPDSDRWDLRLEFPLHPKLSVSAGGSITRAGEGRNLGEWNPDMDHDPAFPSGEVVKEEEIYLSQVFDFTRGSFLSAGGGWRFVSGGEEEKGDGEGFVFLEMVLDF